MQSIASTSRPVICRPAAVQQRTATKAMRATAMTGKALRFNPLRCAAASSSLSTYPLDSPGGLAPARERAVGAGKKNRAQACSPCACRGAPPRLRTAIECGVRPALHGSPSVARTVIVLTQGTAGVCHPMQIPLEPRRLCARALRATWRAGSTTLTQRGG